MNTTGSFVIQLQKMVLKTIRDNRLIKEGETILVGVSGGPDSVCLLHILYALSGILHIKLHAVHINHMLRSDEATADEVYTADLCGRFGIPLHIFKVDVSLMAKKHGMSLEEAGRKARYREFTRQAELVGATKIAVAHNRNDQAETVMMNIIRGSGTTGLIGMEYIRGNIIRPLLNVYRRDIERYCDEARLFPKTDSTNLTDEFMRNRVRLRLFPYIDSNFCSNIVDSLYRLSIHAANDNGFLERCAVSAYNDAIGKKETGLVVLKTDKLIKLDAAILGRVLRLALGDAAGTCAGVGSVHYKALSDLIMKGKTGARAELPGGIRAMISYGDLNIFTEQRSGRRCKEAAPFSTVIVIPGATYVPELNSDVKTSVFTNTDIDINVLLRYNPLVQYFDYSMLNGGINIRNRQNGDIFRPFGSNGTKKLKEYFIDKKIPREMRGHIPLVCMDKEVVWIIGYKTSDKFKVSENTKSILKIEFVRRGS